MRKNSNLSRMLHALLHLDLFTEPVTSDALAVMLGTNPVVVRRSMGKLKARGYVHACKGHQGGWSLAQPLSEITLFDIYSAFDAGSLFTIGLTDSNTFCLIENEINMLLGSTLSEAEALIISKFESTTLESLAINFREKVPKRLREIP